MWPVRNPLWQEHERNPPKFAMPDPVGRNRPATWLPSKPHPARVRARADGRDRPRTPRAGPADGAGPGGVGRETYLPSLRNSDFMRSRFSWPMVSNGICLGQTAAHSPMFVQPPKPSASCCAIIVLTRLYRSG